MPKLVNIPKVGNIQFPDSMSADAITQAAGELHRKAVTDGVTKFMESDPVLKAMKTSERHKALASIAQLLEKHPLLARAADAGMGQVTVAPAVTPDSTAPDQPETQAQESQE